MARLDPQLRPLPDRRRGAEGSPPGASGTTLTPEELARWLGAYADGIADRWAREIQARDSEAEGPLAELLPEFLRLLVSFLPIAVVRWKDHARPLFQQSAELYGNFAALRGLAAGEAVEEMQILREVLLRFLHADPPGEREGEDGGIGLGLRELLQLNRIIDEGVTFASIGHMDTLFFNLLHGTGVSAEPEEEIMAEIQSQVHGLAEEVEGLQQLQPPALSDVREG